MQIQGHTALVTGGGSGLGAAVAHELAREGARAAVLDVGADRAKARAQEIGGLALTGIRVLTIAPGLFAIPLMKELPAEAQQSLANALPLPKRLGHPEGFASLAAHVVTYARLNGEVNRLDGAPRMAPRREGAR